MQEITKEHILSAIAEIDQQGIRSGRHSSTYDLLYEEKLYPPKLVISIANRYATGQELDPKEFYGGPNKPAFDLLTKEGFVIIPKKDKIQNLIVKYKKHIEKTQLKDEVYKWELVNQYKSRPNLEATDLSEEIKSIKYNNLIYYNALTVINSVTKEKPEEVRQLLKMLFDENIDLSKRISDFDDRFLLIYRETNGEHQHHQDERTIACYLTFYNPEKYTFYKHSFYKKLCELLNVKQAKKNEKYAHYLELVNQIIENYIVEDSELIEQVKIYIPEYYDGSNNLLLAQDILYQILDKTQDVKYWLYAPGENADMWEEFYDKGIMALGWDDLGDLNQYQNKDAIEKKLQQLAATDKSKKNDTGANYDFKENMSVGDVVFVKKGRSELLGYGEVTSDYYFDETSNNYHSCRKVSWKKKGNWNAEHSLALKTLTDITRFPTEETAYSKYSERLLGIMEGKKQNVDSNNNDMNHKTSLNQILYGPPGTGKTYTLKTDYFPQYTLKETSITKELFFEETVRMLTWWQVLALALLEDGTSRVNDILNNRWVAVKAAISESKNVRATLWGTLQMHTIQESKTVAYTQRQTPLIFDKKEDKSWVLFETELKDQAPELYEILDSVNNFKANPQNEIKHYVFTTFHQSFSYEDFIEGIKPKMEDENETNEVSYKIEPGIFKELCSRAQNDPNNRYAIFIDEINRGNVSQIFGELITLIETDKRIGAEHEMKVKLPYSKKEFGVPMNVDIYGTMNTADRSVEALDTALRRRFSFKELMPNTAIVAKNDFTDYPRVAIMEKINNRIELLLDRNHTLGHAYFLKPDFKNSFENEIIPLLQEYFFNDYGKIGLVLGKGFVREKSISAIKDKSVFADFETKNEVDIIKSYELIPFHTIDFDIAIQTLLA